MLANLAASSSVGMQIRSKSRHTGSASHLNFYVANGVVAAPVFLGPTDEAALRTLDECFPGRTIEPVACNELIRGRGALHCITRDQPAVTPAG